MRRLVWPLLLSLALVLAACGEDDGELSVEDLPDGTEESETDEDAEGDDPGAEDEGDDADGEDDASEGEGSSEDADEGDDEPAPEPDPAAVEDPCSGREGVDAFLDVVAPVEGQEIGDELELVGCANVPEGTVRYRLTADEETLVDSHTTAECGGPCVGEYRTTVDLGDVDATGEATLEVFWDSPADGSEENRSEIGIVLQ